MCKDEDPDNLGGLGGMLPAEVLKMLNELLEQLHQADYINHGSKLEFVYVASGGQHVETQVNIGAHRNTGLTPNPSPKGEGNFKSEGNFKGRGKNTGIRKTVGSPKTLKYYTHGNNGKLMKQRERVDIVFRLWNEWGWIDDKTTAEDFDAFFEGKLRHCNITWKANSTILTILLQELIKQPYIEKQTGCAAKSLVEQQFGKTANSSRKRLDKDSEVKIRLTLLVLDTKNPLPERHGRTGNEDVNIQEAALREVFAGQLCSTKGI